MPVLLRGPRPDSGPAACADVAPKHERSWLNLPPDSPARALVIQELVDAAMAGEASLVSEKTGTPQSAFGGTSAIAPESASGILMEAASLRSEQVLDLSDWATALRSPVTAERRGFCVRKELSRGTSARRVPATPCAAACEPCVCRMAAPGDCVQS